MQARRQSLDALSFSDFLLGNGAGYQQHPVVTQLMRRAKSPQHTLVSQPQSPASKHGTQRLGASLKSGERIALAAQRVGQRAKHMLELLNKGDSIVTLAELKKRTARIATPNFLRVATILEHVDFGARPGADTNRSEQRRDRHEEVWRKTAQGPQGAVTETEAQCGGADMCHHCRGSVCKHHEESVQSLLSVASLARVAGPACFPPLHQASLVGPVSGSQVAPLLICLCVSFATSLHKPHCERHLACSVDLFSM